MFDFLGRHKADRRASSDRRQVRGPVTIGFEQLEGREMLSAGLCLTIIPSRIPPLARMPRPVVGSIDPEADGEGAIKSLAAQKVRPEPDRRWTRPWPLGGRFRL
jgi:hypothetical protein